MTHRISPNAFARPCLRRNPMISKRAGVRLLIATTAVVAAVGSLLLRGFHSPQSYHMFADQRSFLGVSQFWRRGFQSSFRRGWTLGLVLLLRSNSNAIQ